MDLLLKILLFSFVVFGVVSLTVQYYSVFKRKTISQKRIQQISDFSKPLGVLENVNSSQKAKAKAFIALIMSNYVLVHLMRNKGNKYNDKKHAKRFRKHWSNHQLKKLNALDGGNCDF